MTASALHAAPLVRAQGVNRAFGAGTLLTTAVIDCSCDIYRDELVLIVGPSGSGKTTLISMLGGLLRPTSGSVMLCGHRVSEYEPARCAEVRRKHLGFVFQHYKLFPALTALDNVAEVVALRGHAIAHARSRAAHALAAVGLHDRLHHRPHELFGGERQRVAVARAFAGEPSLIIGDEVTAALDPQSANSVMEILARRVGPRSSVLLVTHDDRLAAWADRVIEMVDGRIVGQSPGQRRSGTKAAARDESAS